MKNKINWNKHWNLDNKLNVTWNWNKNPTPSPTMPPPQPISEEDMIKKIVEGVEDQGFFLAVLDWLKSAAPRKVENFIRQVYSYGNLASYKVMCEFVYHLGFRASENVENRMILGSNNEWVQRYFQDFPIKG